MRCLPPRTKPALLGVAALFLLGLMMPGSARADSCLVADVPAPVILPDGSLHPAGSLRLCFERRLNPSVELQEISMAGQTAGLFRGETFRPEQNSARFPMVHFHRSESGDWILVGFARPGTHRHERPVGLRLTHPRIEQLIAEDRRRATRTADASTGSGEFFEERTILLAAR